MDSLNQYAQNAASAVGAYRAGTNSHWNDSYLNMGAQLMMQEMENQQQLDLWNLMNEYNSPANQMKRFKEAGLNPMLAYTQGTPGNASSQPGYTHANFQLSPHADVQNQIAAASQVISMVSNLAQNVMGIFNAGYDTEIKRNEAAWSNLEYASAARNIAGFGQGRNASVGYRVAQVDGQPHFPESLNPFSSNFSPLEYNTLSRLGKIPDYFRGYMTAEPQRELTWDRSAYQKWYNEKLTPLFERYQEGRATSAEIQAIMDEYNKEAMFMLPPELRGILAPVVEYLSPFLKFIFKSSRGSFNKNTTVNHNLNYSR